MTCLKITKYGTISLWNFCWRAFFKLCFVLNSVTRLHKTLRNFYNITSVILDFDSWSWSGTVKWHHFTLLTTLGVIDIKLIFFSNFYQDISFYDTRNIQTHGNILKMSPLSWPSFHLQTNVILLKEPDQRSWMTRFDL